MDSSCEIMCVLHRLIAKVNVRFWAKKALFTDFCGIAKKEILKKSIGYSKIVVAETTKKE